MRRVAMLGLLVCLTSGCIPSARYVEVTPHGGVVAIPSNSNYWPNYHRDQAMELIEKECPTGFVIEREEEVVVGQTTNTKTHRNTTESPAPVLTLSGHDQEGHEPSFSIIGAGEVQERTRRVTTTTDRTEWRIFYRKAQPLFKQSVSDPPAN